MLNSPIWFFYPQTGGIINLHRTPKHGAIGVSDSELSIVTEEDERIIQCELNDIKYVKRRAPLMTFYFQDGSKFQMSFEEPGLVRGNAWAHAFGSKTGIDSMKPFEDFFSQRGILQ